MIDVRAQVLTSASPVKAADLMRELRIGYNEASRALELLEAQRLVGRQPLAGIPHWSPAFQVNEQRVSMLRKLFGLAPRLVQNGQESPKSSKIVQKLPRATIRRHLDERHPGTASRCARCAKC